MLSKQAMKKAAMIINLKNDVVTAFGKEEKLNDFLWALLHAFTWSREGPTGGCDDKEDSISV